MDSILSLKHIQKQYHQHVAVNDVSLEVPRNSVFGLLGPNGAGKTSLIRIINQITAPDAGEVIFNGNPIRPSDVERIGYLPEERGLYRKMKVGEQCLYLARLKGLSKEEALKRLKYWFEKFEMQSWWGKKVEELSKGMQQKVQFIATVLHEPELLILDEPFSGFDPINANLIKDEILELRKKGITVIFSTHNMASVEEMCDSIALIHRSKKVLDGRVKDIRRQFKTNTYRLSFVGNMVGFSTALWAGAEIVSHEQDEDLHLVSIKLIGNNKPNDLLQAVLPMVELRSFQEVIPGMNEVFIRAVNEHNQGTISNHITE